MNTSYLRYVVEVDKARSISKAAQNLYMGQPNLSKAIKELEADIGITIFRRTPKGVEPTPRGMEFLSYARTILAQLDELESLYKQPVSESVSLRVAAPRATYCAVAFADFISQYARSEHIDVHFRETHADQAIKLAQMGQVDFSIVRYQQTAEGYFESLFSEKRLVKRELWSFHMSLMMASDHPLARMDEVPYHMLAGYTELVHGDYQTPPISFSQIQREAHLPSSMKRVYVYDRGSQYDLLKRMEGSYMWVSPVPQTVLRQNNLVLKPCPLAGVVHKDVLIYPEGKEPNGLAQRYIALLTDRIQGN